MEGKSMDLATILGLVLTMGMVALGLLSQVTDPGQIKYFIHPGSFLVVFGGSLGSAIMSMPLRSLRQAGSVLRAAFRESRADLRPLAASIVRLSEIARRDGILALEPLIPQLEDPFLARGLEMAIDGNDSESISITLRNELEQLQARHQSGRALLELLARYAPAYGMLGTLIGLILMLVPAEVEASPQAVASVPLSGMALALVTTFYGVLLANGVALPLADKLAEKTRQEAMRMEAILNGLGAIQSGDNPRIVEQKLAAFLPPALRNSTC